MGAMNNERIARLRTEHRRSENPIFRLPEHERLDFSGGLPDKSFYARLTQTGEINTEEDDPGRVLWVLEAFSKSWFDENPPPESVPTWLDPRRFIEYYQSARLYALELEVIPQHEWFDAFGSIRDTLDGGKEPYEWFLIESGGPRGDLPIAEIVPLNVFPSIYQDGAALTLENIQPVDDETQEQLNRATSTDHIPDATARDIENALAGASSGAVDWAVVYDVGQGNSIGFGDSGCGVVCYSDIGGGTRKHSSSFPATLQQFCWGEDPPIVLSHWHDDHWSSANRDPAALGQRWIAPRQQNISALSISLISRITNAGGSVLFLPHGFQGTWFGHIHLELCSGSGMNNSGLAITLSEQPDGNGRQILLPGDATYDHIPSFGGGNSYLSIVAPHHGGVMKTTTSIPSCPKNLESRLVYSCGLGNSYKHPRNATRKLHNTAGWRDPNFTASPHYEYRITHDRNNSGLGHVFLAWQSPQTLPSLACLGSNCQLEAQQG